MMMCSLDCFVSQNSIARIIGAFVSGLDLTEQGFKRVEASKEGRPGYTSFYRRFVLKWAEESRKIGGFKPFFGVAEAQFQSKSL